MPTAPPTPDHDFQFETEAELGVAYEVSLEDGEIDITAIVLCGVDILPFLPAGVQLQHLLTSFREAAEREEALNNEDGPNEYDRESAWNPREAYDHFAAGA